MLEYTINIQQKRACFVLKYNKIILKYNDDESISIEHLAIKTKHERFTKIKRRPTYRLILTKTA
jgi:hypothetical protein